MENEKLNILKSIFGSFYSNADEQLFYCPKCNHNKRKFSINLKKGVFKCWVCDFSGKNLDFLVRKYADANQVESWSRANKTSLTSVDFDKLFEAPPASDNRVVDLDLPNGFVSLSSKTREAKQAIKYLKERGISLSKE